MPPPDSELQRIVDTINALLAEQGRELSAADITRLDSARRAVAKFTELINLPDTSDEDRASLEDSRKQRQQDINRLEKKAEVRRGRVHDWTLADARQLVNNFAKEIAEDSGQQLTREDFDILLEDVASTLLVDRPNDIIPEMSPLLADTITDRTRQIQLFPTHVFREEQFGAVAKGLIRDGKITPGQLDALLTDRSNPIYSMIPEEDRAWAGQYILDLNQQLPQIMAGITARAVSEQEGVDLNVPSQFRPVALLSLATSYIRNLNPKKFAAGETAVPPTRPPEAPTEGPWDRFARGPSGGDANMKQALAEVLRTTRGSSGQFHIVNEAQIHDPDLKKATTAAIAEYAAKLDDYRALLRSKGFNEEQIAYALFRAAQDFAAPPTVAEGDIDPEAPPLSPFEEAVGFSGLRAEDAAAAKKLESQGGANAAVNAYLNSRLLTKGDILDKHFLEMAKAVKDAQSIDVLDEQFRDVIPRFLADKIATDLRKYPEAREDAVEAFLKNQGVADPKNNISDERLFEMQGAVQLAGSLDALEQFIPLIPQFRQEKATADFVEDPRQIKAYVESFLPDDVDPEVVESAVRQIQLGVRADPLYDIDGFLGRLVQGRVGQEPETPERELQVSPFDGRQRTKGEPRILPDIERDDEGQPIRAPIRQAELAPARQPFANLARTLVEDRSGETVLTQRQAVDAGLPVEGGFDPRGRDRIPTIGELTAELGPDAVTGLFTVEDVERRLGQLPPNIPEAFGDPANFRTPAGIPGGHLIPTGSTPLPDINTQRAVPRAQLLGLDVPADRAFRNRINELIADLAGGDVDFQRFLAQEVGGLVEPFRQQQLALQGERETAAADFLRPLEERGLFTPAQRGAFVRQTAIKPRKVFETEFPGFVRSETPGLRQQFRLTPTFIDRTQREEAARKREIATAAATAKRESEAAGRQAERDVAEAERVRQRKLRSRGRTVFSRRRIA